MEDTSLTDKKEPRFNLRLTEETRALLDATAKKVGISRAAVVTLAVQEFAKKKGVSVPDTADKSQT